MERIQKVIAQSGLSSRRKAEELILKGKVKVDGVIITELGTKVTGKELIEVDGHILKKESKEYYLLYKPRGIITSTKDEKNRKTVVDLIQTEQRIYPVGRLDYDTSGIILLTNDGELTNFLIHPKNRVDKVYLAKIKGIMSGDAIRQLEKGILLDHVKTARAKVKVKKVDRKNKTSLVELTIHEGKNHQVKRMFEAVGYEVLKLKRERFGSFDLSGLKSGEYRKLTPKEVKKLYVEVKKSV